MTRRRAGLSISLARTAHKPPHLPDSQGMDIKALGETLAWRMVAQRPLGRPAFLPLRHRKRYYRTLTEG